jgi:hypothetical protein
MISENPLPLIIHCDWNRIRKIYQKLVENYSNDFFNNRKQWIDCSRQTACDIGRYGRLSYSQTITKEPWFQWSGLLLESLVPWAGKLREHTLSAGLCLQNFSYFHHYGNVNCHIDIKETKDKSFEKNQCNVNYIIVAEDQQSKSFFEHHDGVHYYISKENCAYLIDSGVSHWVTNTGYREVFQIRFHDSYKSVKNFFDTNPMELR